MAKYLIVNADDYGLCDASNKAVEELFEGGWLKSATVMMTCPGAAEAVKFSVDHPEYPVGIHLTLTSEWATYRWRPLTDGTSLVDKDGFMWHESREVERHTKYKEVEAEIRAQIDLAHSMGMKPSHVDNHMGSLYGSHAGRISFGKMALRVCGEYGYAYRIFSKHDKRFAWKGVPNFVYDALTLLINRYAKKYNVVIPDYLLFPEWNEKMRESYEIYRDTILKIWTDIPDGITETFIHPAVEDDELKTITSRWKDRVWEYKLMKDPYVQNYLKNCGVELVSYRELISMKNRT